MKGEGICKGLWSPCKILWLLRTSYEIGVYRHYCWGEMVGILRQNAGELGNIDDTL